jgi:hypothetical protein
MVSVSGVLGQAAPASPATDSAAVPSFAPDLAEVVKMVQAQKPQEEILTQIRTCPRLYNLSASDAVSLDKFGVPPKVVMAMVDHDKALARQEYTPTPSTTEGTAAAQGAAKGAPAAKEVQPAANSMVSKPKGTPPPATPRGQKVWTSSIIVEKAPPARKLELIPKSPGRDYVWIRGHWAWKDGIWTWEDGYWLQRPGPDIQWMDGDWSRHGKGWIWIPGHWR